MDHVPLPGKPGVFVYICTKLSELTETQKRARGKKGADMSVGAGRRLQEFPGARRGDS